MSDDKMRQDFEAWYRQNMMSGMDEAEQEKRLGRHENGEYFDYWLRRAWQIWQASRATLVVELPSCFEAFGYSAEAARLAVEGCADAIAEAGVSVA